MCRDTLLVFFKHRKTQLSILTTSVDSIRREESEQLAKLHKLKARAVRFTGSPTCAAKQKVIWFACGHWQDADAEDDCCPPRCIVCGTVGQKNMDKKIPTTTIRRSPASFSSSFSLMVCVHGFFLQKQVVYVNVCACVYALCRMYSTICSIQEDLCYNSLS